MPGLGLGSPPRRRGKGQALLADDFGVGSTPAQAGKSTGLSSWALTTKDHPRTGGEKLFRLPLFQSPLGSPPHRRGKDFSVICALEEDRITPAWAGKRAMRSAAGSGSGDHPRVGGEKRPAFSMMDSVSGSPPRRRGKGDDACLDGLHHGITPAWAGKSPASQPWSPPLWMMVIRPRP